MPTCLKISNATAASKPARAALRKLIDSRGSRAIIQVNSSHEMRSDITIEANRRPMPMPGSILQPKPFDDMLHHSSELLSAVSAIVTMIATNKPIMAIEIGELGADETAGLLSLQAPHLAQRLAEIGHPAQPGPCGRGQADDEQYATVERLT